MTLLETDEEIRLDERTTLLEKDGDSTDDERADELDNEHATRFADGREATQFGSVT
jgi:hypothetical protein